LEEGEKISKGAIYTTNGFNALLNRGYKSSPDYTVPSRYKIGAGTTTPAITDTDLGIPITGWYAAGDYKNFVAGYPTFDTANKKVTVQAFIASTEANGNSISEIGCFNTDASPVMSDHIVFTSITKTSAVQVFITTTYRRV